jgi:hypothetical protein
MYDRYIVLSRLYATDISDFLLERNYGRYGTTLKFTKEKNKF